MPVVRIWKRDGGSEEPPRTPAVESKEGAAQVPAPQSKSPNAAQAATESDEPEEAEPVTDVPVAEPTTTSAVAASAPARTQAPPANNGQWDLEIRPHRSVITARIVAVGLAIFFTVAGIFLRSGPTGVTFRVSDQIGLAVFGFILGGAVLVLTRPRVRVGPGGVVVRNILGDNEFRWPDIRGVSFADKKSWARLELAHDEYVPLMAIRTNDKIRAADAMDRFRELGAKYTAENAG